MLPKLYINPGSTFVRNKENPVSTPSRSSLTSSKYSKKEAASAPSRGSLISPRDNSSTPTRASLYGTTFKPSSSSSSLYDDLIKNESGGRYDAFNPAGGGEGAVGKHQLRWKLHDSKVNKFAVKYGYTTKDKPITARDYMDNPKLQDEFFEKDWVPNHIMPEVNKIKSTLNTNLSDKQLIYLVHFRGGRGAKEYLKGNVSDKPETYNMSISGYIGANKKALGGYLGNNKPKYKKEFGGVLSTLSGAASGAAAGNSLLPGGIGAGVGGALGLVTSIAGNIKDAKIKKRIASREKANLDMQFQNNSEAAYSSYLPVNTGGFYAKGGNIPQPESYEAEKGEVVLGNPQLEDGKQLAEGVHEVGGNKHSEGGTQGVGGDFIFSDALLVPESDFQILKTLGLGLKGKKTYADMAKVIGKFKGKYDRNSNNYRKNNTDAEMSKRIEDSLMLLAQSQEELKGTMGEGQNNYALGGQLKEWWKSPDTEKTSLLNPIKPTGIDVNKSRFNELPKSLPKFDSPKSENNIQGKNKIPSGVLSSTAGYLNDLNTANNIDTDIPLYMTPKSRLDYTDRSGYMMDRNNQALNNFTNTRTGTPKNLQGAYAATLKANNQVGLAEAERQDKAVTDYNNKNMYIDSQTAQQYNRNAYLENNLVNTKNENVGGSFSSYLGNLDTVKREQNAMELDNKRLEILREQSKLRGGIEESFAELLKKNGYMPKSTTN